MHRISLLAATAAATLLAGGGFTAASASTTSSAGFESFEIGNVNGQHGWTRTGSYDVEIADPDELGVTDMGTRALRMSNAVTSGSFGDQTFSAELSDEAGESSAEGDGSGGTRQSTFTATFSLRTTSADEQPGLATSVSPDRGDGARMSYLRFEDEAAGVEVYFDDFAGGDFREELVATLDRANKHTIGLAMLFRDGPANDVVNVSVDGVVVHTGTSWEDYFRDVELNESRTVDSLLFREAGVAQPALAGQGFLVDDVALSSGAPECLFSDVGTTRTLLADCTTDRTIYVPDGYTLDGDGHTITAVDPVGGHFTGAVVQNVGDAASIQNLGVTASGLASICDAGDDRLFGIRLDGASGTIEDNVVTGIQQGASGDGCQEGNAIDVSNDAKVATPSVQVIGNEVADYQKTGIRVTGDVSANVRENQISGYGPVAFIAQNGVQVSFGASALVEDNAISGNDYTPESYVSCGVLLYEADGVKVRRIDYVGNEKNLCNFGRGGGQVSGS